MGARSFAALVLATRRTCRAARTQVRPRPLGDRSCAVLLVWSSVRPSNERVWQPEVTILPGAIINGDLTAVHNIRNFGRI
jgi:hypothetical protein